MTFLDSLRQTLADPHARHAMLVHLPIVLGGMGALPLVAAAAGRFRSRALIGVTVAMFLLASLGAGLAASAGEDAADGVADAYPNLPADQRAAVRDHEELGENGWVWPLIPAALAGLALIVKPGTGRAAAGLLAIAAGVGVGVWVALTAHAGGQLVYVHGLGVPSSSGSPSSHAPIGVPMTSQDDDDRNDK